MQDEYKNPLLRSFLEATFGKMDFTGLSPEQKKAIEGMKAYLEKVLDDPRSDWPPDEMAAVARVAAEILEKCRGLEIWRLAIELPADVDKHRLIYLGLLPLIYEHAEQRGRIVVWLAPDDNSMRRAEIMHQLFNMDQPEVGLWYNLAPLNLDNLWIIGDLDWSDKQIAGYHGEAVVKAVNRVLSTESCPTLLVHQQGKTPIIPFPPQFETSSSSSLVSPSLSPGGRLLKGHSERIMSVAITSDGHRALSGGWDQTVRLWDLESGSEIFCFEGHKGFVSAVAFLGDGRRGRFCRCRQYIAGLGLQRWPRDLWSEKALIHYPPTGGVG